jgi:DUF3047 family protein
MRLAMQVPLRLGFAICLCLAPGLACAQSAAGVVAAFSSAKASAPIPPPWQVVKITERKNPTKYDLVEDAGTVVLHAVADNAATGLGYPAGIELKSAPILSWRWKVANLIASADNAEASKEDSPVRIVLDFEGDKSKLSLVDRAAMAVAEQISGRELPYATLMYIWSNKVPVGTVIPNPRTKRVQMIVASSGSAGVGTWQTLSRDVFADFRRAFGEDPGKVRAVGVLTDTDNTGEHAEAWYGDIRLSPAR